VAALWPALTCALEQGRQLFFVTAKVSQQELALDTLARLLQGAEPPIPHASPLAVQIATRERHCPRDGRHCAEPVCRLRRATSQGAAEILESLHQSTVARAEEIRRSALEHGLCPFEVSLQLAERAAAIVGDVNYVFDPQSYLRRFFDKDYARQLLVVDEAHNLPDRVAAYASPELSLSGLEALASRCDQAFAGRLPEAAEWLRAVAARVREQVVTLATERGSPPPYVEYGAPAGFEALARAGDGLRERYEALVAEHPGFSLLLPSLGIRVLGGAVSQAGRPPHHPGTMRERGSLPASRTRRDADSGVRRDPLLEALVAVSGIALLRRERPTTYASISEHDGVRLICLDPGERIAERVFGFHACIGMSATLTPFAFHQRRLGLDAPRVLTTEIPSPFPPENRLILVVPDIDTRLAMRESEARRVLSLLLSCVRVRRGNYLAFFPSYAYRDLVLSHVGRSMRGEVEWLLQLPGMPTEPLLKRLKQPSPRSRVLCAVHGGSFSEGVDFPGDMAIGAFIIGPGLPAVSVDREVLRGHYDACPPELSFCEDSLSPGAEERRAQGRGFEFAYAFPALQRVVQAAGRVIRTPRDRAFVLLIGQRFTEPFYAEKLPSDWRRDWRQVQDPALTLREFWSEKPASAASHGRVAATELQS